MNTLVIYESMYGNTRLIAEAIARGLHRSGTVDVVPASHARECDIDTYALLVVGGPTHVHGMSRLRTRDAAIVAASRPDSTVHLEAGASSAGLREWLSTLAPSPHGLAAAFDTRIDKSPFLTGRASKVIARKLRRVHLDIVAPPESFLVDAESNLKAHEIERAEQWGQSLAAKAAQLRTN